MSQQIAVRLHADLLGFLDAQVGAGAGPSRAAVVARALARERRRALATRDSGLLTLGEPCRDLVGLVEYASHLPLEG